MKTCPVCGETKETSEFFNNRQAKDGLQYRCKVCSRAYANQWAKDNRARLSGLKRKYVNRRLYGIEPEDVSAQLRKQGDGCAICGGVDDRELAIDHCHATGRLRGLLCLNCNNGLGRFKDNPDRLRAAAAYVEAGGVWA